MGKKEYRVYEIMALLAEEITPKLDTVRAERRAFMQYQKASAELERLRKRPTPKWTDHHAKVARKESQIAEWELDVDQGVPLEGTSDARGWCRGEESG